MTSTVRRHQRSPLFSLANISVTVQIWIYVDVLGYIGIVWPKEHSPEVWSVPPVTPCINTYVPTYIHIHKHTHTPVRKRRLTPPFGDHLASLEKHAQRKEHLWQTNKQTGYLTSQEIPKEWVFETANFRCIPPRGRTGKTALKQKSISTARTRLELHYMRCLYLPETMRISMLSSVRCSASLKFRESTSAIYNGVAGRIVYGRHSMWFPLSKAGL